MHRLHKTAHNGPQAETQVDLPYHRFEKFFCICWYAPKLLSSTLPLTNRACKNAPANTADFPSFAFAGAYLHPIASIATQISN